MRIVFMGTPDFAVPSLRALIADPQIEVCAVLTQPDRINRRGNKKQFSPVKEVASAHALPLLQPASLRERETVAYLKNLQADLFVVVAYGKILPAAVLQLPRFGCVNVHASLLPRYRGAAPIQRSIMNGDTVTGISIMQLDEGMDTGDILLQREIPLNNITDFVALSEQLAELGAASLLTVLQDIPFYLKQALPQAHTAATYADKIRKEEGIIDWREPSVHIVRLINALHVNPGTFTNFRGKRLKIHHALPIDISTENTPGQIVGLSDKGIQIATGDKAVLLTEMQMENKGKVAARDFINGYQIQIGEILG